ncbi:putative aquaporin NIP4-2, partial [Bienertia sinuspersici]
TNKPQNKTLNPYFSLSLSLSSSHLLQAFNSPPATFFHPSPILSLSGSLAEDLAISYLQLFVLPVALAASEAPNSNNQIFATMTLLEQILKASSVPKTNDEPLNYPFTLSSESIIPNLKPFSENPFSPLQPLTGFQISQSDSDLIESNSEFFKKLKRKVKSPHSLTSSSFIKMLNSFLHIIGEKKFGGLDGLGENKDEEGEGYTCKLVEKCGSFIGRDVMGLVIEGCLVLGNWEILKTLIVNKFIVDHGLRSELLYNLVSKGRCDLVSLCLRYFTDLESSDLGRILKCFLSPSKDGCLNMAIVKDEWESDANAAIDKLSNNKKLSGKKLALAKDAALLLMTAYDQFTPSELCLHFMLSPSNVDEVVFSSAVSKLNTDEMLSFVRYLGKWLRKYERFPQVGPCPKAAAKLGLNMCQWVPRLEDVVKSLGLVVDEHFSSLALHSDFHEDLKAVEGVVSSLASEGRLCCSVASLIEILKPEIGGV